MAAFRNPWAALALLAVASCSPPGDPDVTGRLLDGTAGIRVFVYPARFDARVDSLPAANQSETDARGRFAFSSLPAGTYNLVALSGAVGSESRGGYVQGIRVGASERITIPAFRLQPLGALRLPKGDGLGQGVGALVLPGSPWHLVIVDPDTSAAALVLPVPSGAYRELRWIGGEAEMDVNTLGDTLSVAPAETATIEIYHAWSHSRTYVLADSLAVPGVAGGVPILIRLDASTFDFAEARGEGQDLRFTGSDGLILPHQTERWDSSGRLAEIWVRLPVPNIANEGRTIRMRWGHPEAPDVTPPYRVFPSSDGYAAVWHLAEEDSGAHASPTYRNSARDGDHGLDHVPGIDRGGVIGQGHGFDTTGHVRVLYATPALRPAATFTLAAWYQADTTGTHGSMLATMGESWGLRVDSLGAFQPFINVDSNYRSPAAGRHVLDGRWHFLAATYDGQALRAYVDGLQTDTLAIAVTFDYAYGKDFILGAASHFKKGQSTIGRLDEVQVLAAARSPEWIRFAFETQRPGSKALGR